MDTEDLSDPPTSIDPYAVLELPQTATEAEIKSAYKKLALKRHPDKAPSSERAAAHQSFQDLAFAYAILSDARRRARYDRTGSTAESLEVDDDDFNWVDFFRSQFKEVVTADKIAELKQTYQHSDEERQDVLKAYTQSKGDLDGVFESVLLCSVLDDELRFREYIDSAIGNKEVEGYDKYVTESETRKLKRRKKAEKEREEAEEMAHDMGIHEEVFGKEDGKTNGETGKGEKTRKSAAKKKVAKKNNDDDLVAMISKRAAEREGKHAAFLDGLEKKYAGGDKKKKRKMEEPSEEAFQEMARRGKKSQEEPVKNKRRAKA